jgi:hypothetical protein
VLDSHVLAVVAINPESRVSVTAGLARRELVEAGTRLFLVKVLNDAGVTAPLTVERAVGICFRRPDGAGVAEAGWRGLLPSTSSSAVRVGGKTQRRGFGSARS